MPAPGPTSPTCSFCGKNKNEVKVLIEGPRVFICNECVSLCCDIIAEEVGGPDARLERIADELSAVAALLGEMPQTRGLLEEAELLARELKAFATAEGPS